MKHRQNPKTKYQVNELVFDTINEQSAYWLGFLYADGCVRTRKHSSHGNINAKKDATIGSFKLKIKLTDRDHLEKFRRFLDCNIPIITGRQCVVTSDGVKHFSDFCAIEVNRIHMAERLIELGCTPHKSFTLKFPNKIQYCFLNHFIRGVFDGDGCISKNKKTKGSVFSILGTKNLLNGIKRMLDSFTTTKGTISKLGKIYNLQYCKNSSIIKIREFLYSKASIFLERKHEVFHSIEKIIQLADWPMALKFLKKNKIDTQEKWSQYRQSNEIKFIPHNIKRYYKLPKNLTLKDLISNS